MAAMNEHPITKYLKLPFQFDEKRLNEDLALVTETKWIPHFNTGGYTGNWKAISLYSTDGTEQNIYMPLTNNQALSATPLMQDCRYFQEVLDSFRFHILAVRLLRLEAGAEIKPHTDHELGYEDGQFRLHIPIVTNPDIEFILDGERLTMLPGECWYTNVNFVHSVANRGTIDRVHLVVDGIRNTWTDQLFFSLAPEKSFEIAKDTTVSTEMLKQVLEQLKNNPQVNNAALISELEKQLELSISQQKNRSQIETGFA
jgi:quercetin dioxygenase-like cupin family protein